MDASLSLPKAKAGQSPRQGVWGFAYAGVEAATEKVVGLRAAVCGRQKLKMLFVYTFINMSFISFILFPLSEEIYD